MAPPTDEVSTLMAELHEAKATLTVAQKFLRWVGAITASAAIAWAARTDVRVSMLENMLAELNGDRRAVIEEYRRFQDQTYQQLATLIAVVGEQGKQLAGLAAKIELLHK